MDFGTENSLENRVFWWLNMCMFILFLVCLRVVDAQTSSGHGLPPGEAVTNFKPSLAVVVGVLAIMFSITFVLLIFAKCCHRISYQNSRLHDRILSQSMSRCYSGIDKTVIESLPFFRFSALKGSKQGLECAVCLSKFEDIEILRLLPKCKHAFHIDCVDQWLEKHSSCPLCRQRISPDDVAFCTYSTSMRFLQSQSSLRQDSNLELFVEREDDSRQGSCRFGHGSSSNSNKEEQLPIQGNSDNNNNNNNDNENDEILHKYNHRIIVSEVVLKNRWSSVSSSDLMFLNSQMINAMSSEIFLLDSERMATTKGGDQMMNIKEEMDTKRLFKKKISQNGLIPLLGVTNDSLYRNSSKILDPNEKRSMSEIVVHPRFTEFSPRNVAEDSYNSTHNVKEERLRRMWLPIASRTVDWFANREKRHPPMSQNTGQSLDV